WAERGSRNNSGGSQQQQWVAYARSVRRWARAPARGTCSVWNRAHQHKQPLGSVVRRKGDSRHWDIGRSRRARYDHVADPCGPARGRLMKLKLLVVDEEPLAREGMKVLLGRQSQVDSVSEARNGRVEIMQSR